MPPPPVTRRTALALLATAAGSLPFVASGALASTPRANPTRFYLGSVQYDIGVASADPTSGTLSVDALVPGTRSSFLAVSPSAEALYSVNGDDGGRLEAFALDADGAVQGELGSTSGLGDGPCHVSVHPAGGHAFSANYNDGTVTVVALAPDGAPGEITQVVRHEGSGPGPDRQEGPHAHQVLPDPGGERLFAVDLGTDSVFVYAFDAEAGQLAQEHEAKLPPGSGPRHMAFHPGGVTAYVLGELDSTLTACGYDSGTGALTPGAVVPLLPDGTPPDGNSAAEVLVTSDGRFVYASNRGHDSIVVFAVDGEDEAEPRLVGHFDSGGATPRHISLDADESHLYVANQSTGAVVVLDRDPDDGTLAPTGAALDFPGVECVLPAVTA
ncbi:lactonase family protein [Streptomyces profundus]|uniref:lactonase family protein n=1 Tax=Streptomyces profundus TaxID=2867410 RepID=UPI001D15E50E|nr:lactonase family protein [Streptomyces sp. MA3_2.13]UED87752.1 lactonase family protein [Streptomyces sp. MA3_2.13]